MSDDIQFNLRLPKSIKDAIAEAAKLNGRSINSEAAFRLQKTLEQDQFMSSSNGCDEIIDAVQEAESNTNNLQTKLDNIGGSDIDSSVFTTRILKKLESIEKTLMDNQSVQKFNNDQLCEQEDKQKTKNLKTIKIENCLNKKAP
ncbi:Arc family DNA-binding protein [Acinetobacter chinensis]|uniref:Arc family DNA-binding protein n=1 Tax=Acinetobacter chinensis TaxID=2004650 RepID=UPI00293476BE|nr:Arc family DNA-binding protein [Acinetobacter chinensis]WOE40074.1 Arc family DNA-binding protein [Acinetobacter chinensis]